MVFTILLVLVFNPLHAAPVAVHAQSSPRERAQALLDGLTPEERVGQLFLITFQGNDVTPESQIYDLIVNHHIGGVFLQWNNDNIVYPQTLQELLDLTRRLQATEWSASQSMQVEPVSDFEFQPAFIPMLIGISQDGDGYPYDQILNGVTPLPSQMAIGATWRPDLSKAAGSILGKELSSLGVNLLLGPSLDVLETPRLRGADDLGVRTFGGDPYWVSEMGRAYIEGIREGSNSRIAIVGKHFPGHGSADRLPEEEVATVRKTLDSLKSIELVPFYSVTGNALSTSQTIDALLASHIRYQGFQGNIRETTNPVSLDPQAFSELLRQLPLASWRERGGVMISDNLGSQAFRRYKEPSRLVARDAFMTGNDILFLGTDFVAPGDPDAYTTVVKTLSFFAQKYREDPLFEQRVNESALRVLTLKYRLYDNIFTLNQVQSPLEGLADIGRGEQISFEISQSAATLLHPSLTDLAETLPEPPGLNDRVVFITDARTARQCSFCPDQTILAVNALEQAVIRLYGPQAGGQVLQRNLDSYSLTDLMEYLNAGETEEIPEIEIDLQQAHWIVYVIVSVSSNDPVSQTLPRFLAERPDLFRQKRLVVFALNSPYFLDATEVSKLTAYYALYSKNPHAIEVAARLLFGEIPFPPGASPVSVPGVDYDLITAIAPDPSQIIEISLDLPQSTGEDGVPEQPVIFDVGDLVAVKTNVIRDHNGNPVPDGTQVEFHFRYNNETITQKEITRQGIARTSYLISRSGTLEITAESEPATQSTPLRFEIAPDETTGLAATPSPQPTETPTLEPTPTTTPEPENIPPSVENPRPNMGDWLLAVLVTGSFGGAIFWFTTSTGMLRWGIRSAFLALIGGLVAYTYLAFKLPGSDLFMENVGAWGILLVALTGSMIGWGAAWGWRWLEDGSK